MNLIRTAALAAALATATTAAAQATYRCTAKDGRKYYSSTIPRQCIGRIVEELNSQGSVVRRIDPQGDEIAREAKEAELAKKKAQETANREEERRNEALLATYTSVRDIDDARKRALADSEKAMRDVQSQIDAIRKRRAGYEKELAFYKGKTPPQKLTDDIQSTDVDLKANEDLLAVKKQEMERINTRYDSDRKRYIELTRRR